MQVGTDADCALAGRAMLAAHATLLASERELGDP